MSDETKKGGGGGIEPGPEPDISLSPELMRTLETVVDEESQRRMSAAAEAARQSVRIVNPPGADEEAREAAARQLRARARSRRRLLLLVLVIATAIAGLLLARFFLAGEQAPPHRPRHAASPSPAPDGRRCARGPSPACPRHFSGGGASSPASAATRGLPLTGA
jgi:hypothetical protein